MSHFTSRTRELPGARRRKSGPFGERNFCAGSVWKGEPFDAIGPPPYGITGVTFPGRLFGIPVDASFPRCFRSALGETAFSPSPPADIRVADVISADQPLFKAQIGLRPRGALSVDGASCGLSASKAAR